jgi:hypothetical protein
MKSTNRLHVGSSAVSHTSSHPWTFHGHHPHVPRWAPFAWVPLLAVGIAALGALLLRSHAPERPLPVSVARVSSTAPVELPAPPPDKSLPTTTTRPGADGKPEIMRVEAPPMIIEVTVKR